MFDSGRVREVGWRGDETGRVKAWSGALWYRNEMYMSIFASIGV
jgi:hypothetical protein